MYILKFVKGSDQTINTYSMTGSMKILRKKDSPLIFQQSSERYYVFSAISSKSLKNLAVIYQ